MLRPVSVQERLADDIGGIVHRLQRDQAFILMYWNGHRLREPLMDALESEWQAFTLPQLMLLDDHQADAVEAFYRAYRRFRAFAEHTEAMPETLGKRIAAGLHEMWPLALDACDALGIEPAVWTPDDE